MLYRLQEETALLTAQLQVIKKDEARLEHRVKLLCPKQLDPDLLAERVQSVLHLIPANQFVLRLPPGIALAD